MTHGNPSPQTCSACGTPVERGDAFCTHCGAPLRPREPTASHSTAAPPPSASPGCDAAAPPVGGTAQTTSGGGLPTAGVAAGIGGVLLVLTAAAWFFFHHVTARTTTASAPPARGMMLPAAGAAPQTAAPPAPGTDASQPATTTGAPSASTHPASDPWRMVARVPIPGQEDIIPNYLTARIDGRDCVVVVELTDDQAATEITAYGWRDGAFRRIASARVDLGEQIPVAGDLDGDGNAEIIGIARNNRIARVRWSNGGFEVTYGPRLTEQPVGAIALADVRSSGQPELILALATKRPPQSDDRPPELPAYDRLQAFRYDGGQWTPSWSQGFGPRIGNLCLMSGRYAPGAGPQLVVEDAPGEFGDGLIEVWRWNGKALERTARSRSSIRTGAGHVWWVGTVPDASGSSPAIVSYSVRSTGKEDLDQGLILRWDGNQATIAGILDGQPLAVGEFRGPGRTGIIAYTHGDSPALLEQ